jgi:predicted metal-dependent hydrolase
MREARTDEIPEYLQVGEEVLPLVIRRHHRAKRICLRYNPTDHAISLTLPRYTHVQAGLSFLTQKSEWLLETLQGAPRKKHLKPGVVIPLMGDRIRIRHDAKQHHAWVLHHGTLTIGGDRDDFDKRMAEAIKKIAKREISKLATRHAKKVGRHIHRISVRDTRSRWGSCSSAGNLSFSWRLVFAPTEVFDYVVAHEVAHLRHMNHGARFWNLVSILCPDYEVAKAWLRLHGRELYRYHID